MNELTELQPSQACMYLGITKYLTDYEVFRIFGTKANAKHWFALRLIVSDKEGNKHYEDFSWPQCERVFNFGKEEADIYFAHVAIHIKGQLKCFDQITYNQSF